jgi:acyl carrier protein
MIPSSFVFLDAMPLTPNDKIDRRALPAPTAEAGDPSDFVAPRNPVEELLVEIWCEVLKVDHVSVMSSFFDLGGHSLLAARLMGRIRSSLGANLSISKLFDNPTVAGLADIIGVQSLTRQTRTVALSRRLVEAMSGSRGAPKHTVVDSVPLNGTIGSLLRTPSLSAEHKDRQRRLRSRSENFTASDHQSSTGQIPDSFAALLSPSSVSESVRDTYLSAWMQQKHGMARENDGAAEKRRGEDGRVVHRNRVFGSSVTGSSLRSRTVGGDGGGGGGSGAFLRQRGDLGMKGSAISGPSLGRSLRTTSAQLTPFGMTPTRARRNGMDKHGNTDTHYSTDRRGRGGGHDASLQEEATLGRTSRGSGLQGIDLPPNSYSLSFNQRSLWFMQKVDPKRVDYVVHHVSSVVSSSQAPLASSLDVDRLRLAFRAVCVRHPSLSTTFAEMDGVPFQRLQPHVHEDMFSVVDSSYWTHDQLNNAISMQLHTPWDLLRGPVFKVHLYKGARGRGSGHIALLITAHHIAMDGISLDLLLRDVGICHRRALSVAASADTTELELAQKVFGKAKVTAFSSGEGDGDETEDAIAPNREIQVFEFASLQAEYICSTEGDRLWGYWQRELAGHPPTLNLHTDFKRPPVQDTKGDWVKVTLDADLVRGMRALVQRERVTLYAGLLTVFQVMLHRYSGQDDILVGSPFAGRHPFDEGLAEVVGNFANSVVLRSTCSSSEPVTFRKMLKRTWGKVCCSSSFFF